MNTHKNSRNPCTTHRGKQTLPVDDFYFYMVRVCWTCKPCDGLGHVFRDKGCFVCKDCEPVRDALRKRYGYSVPMGLGTPPGKKVRYCCPFNGWDWDQKSARKHLVLGAYYTVAHVEVGDCQSEVWLEEFPGQSFNTVLFSEAQ